MSMAVATTSSKGAGHIHGVPKRLHDAKKPGPSGMSQNQAFSLPEDWGGKNCLLKIEDTNIIKKLKEELGGDELVSFLSPEFSVRAQKAYDSLDISDLTFEN